MRKISSIFLGLFASLSFAQQPQLITEVDSTQIKIGSQFNLTVKVTAPANTHIAFPDLKNIGQLEVLENYPTDTLLNDAQTAFIKKYALTQFDSGTYAIPSFPILIGNKQVLTDSAKIIVNNVQVDTLKQKMFDDTYVRMIQLYCPGGKMDLLHLLIIFGRIENLKQLQKKNLFLQLQ